MAVTEIDIIQTEKIEALQNDVVEIKDKLNLVVADITSLTSKLNQAIADADDLNGVINDGYSTPSGGGSAGVGILKRLDDLFDQFQEHRNQYTSQSAPSGYKEVHPEVSGTLNSYSPNPSNIRATAQGNNNPRSTFTATAQTASVTGVYTPEKQGVMTLKTKAEVRARKHARTLLKKTRR